METSSTAQTACWTLKEALNPWGSLTSCRAFSPVTPETVSPKKKGFSIFSALRKGFMDENRCFNKVVQCRVMLVEGISSCSEQLGGMPDRSGRADVQCPKISRRCSLYAQISHRSQKDLFQLSCKSTGSQHIAQEHLIIHEITHSDQLRNSPRWRYWCSAA